MITQRQRWVPGPQGIRFFWLWTGESENGLLGRSEAPSVPFHSAISHGVLGACLRAPTHRQALAVGNSGLGLASTCPLPAAGCLLVVPVFAVVSVHDHVHGFIRCVLPAARCHLPALSCRLPSACCRLPAIKTGSGSPIIATRVLNLNLLFAQSRPYSPTASRTRWTNSGSYRIPAATAFSR